MKCISQSGPDPNPVLYGSYRSPLDAVEDPDRAATRPCGLPSERGGIALPARRRIRPHSEPLTSQTAAGHFGRQRYCRIGWTRERPNNTQQAAQWRYEETCSAIISKVGPKSADRSRATSLIL